MILITNANLILMAYGILRPHQDWLGCDNQESGMHFHSCSKIIIFLSLPLKKASGFNKILSYDKIMKTSMRPLV